MIELSIYQKSKNPFFSCSFGILVVKSKVECGKSL